MSLDRSRAFFIEAKGEAEALLYTCHEIHFHFRNTTILKVGKDSIDNERGRGIR